MKTKKITLITLFSLLVCALVVLLCLYFNQKREMQVIVNQMEFEKEQLEDEYENLAMEFDGYATPTLSNDSLTQLLHKEQQRVQDLLEELRITKATNAQRIAELKRELATVRSAMVSYVHQIDSLNQTNARLSQENQQVRKQYEQVTQHAQALQQENEQLNAKVTMASMLEITAFDVVPLNKRDKKTSSFKQIQKVEFDFTIGKNITTGRGIKTVYLRVVRPDGELITLPDPDQRLFRFENSDIEYSLSKDIEYDGNELPDVLYWTVEEILQPGTYNADFFIDGNLIGSFPFELKR